MTKSYKHETNRRNDPETREGALKHNVKIGNEAGTISSTREVGQPKAREPESTMAKHLLTHVDSNWEGQRHG